jgi:hypothetical protein
MSRADDSNPFEICGRPQQWFGANVAFTPADASTSSAASPISGS